MSNPFKKGDEVEYTPIYTHVDMTSGKVYEVLGTDGTYIEVLDDAGDTHDIGDEHFKLYTGSQTAAVPSPRAQAGSGTFTAQYGTDPYTLAVGEDEQGEEDYDTRKANSRVTSLGKFEEGQSVVYLDGTPTPDGLTVKRCTSTCVWFEETYSMPFNPEEFGRVEDGY